MVTSVLSLARDGEAETIRVDQRAKPGNKWAHSGVVEYNKVRHKVRLLRSLMLVSMYHQVFSGGEEYTNDVLTVTSTIPALGVKAVRKFRRIKTNHPETDRLRRHSVL